MKKVVKKEIIKRFNASIIYPILDSEWVSLVQCVYKKEGRMVVESVHNELIPTKTMTSWRICMDYRKLDKAIKKDHFSMRFIDCWTD